MINNISILINNIIDCAKNIYDELGIGWSESIYHNAMEVALREKGIDYDTHRTITVSYHNHIIGDGEIDILPFINNPDNSRVYLIIELKTSNNIINGDIIQTLKYIRELSKQLSLPYTVHNNAIIINFSNMGNGKGINNYLVTNNGVQYYICSL